MKSKHWLLCSVRTLTTGADSWEFTDSLLSKYEVTQGLTKDTVGGWTEGPRDWLGEFVSWDVVEDLAGWFVGLNMAVCMRRISLSWSPDSLSLLDCRPCLVSFWGDDDDCGFSGVGSDSGVGGMSARGKGCLLGVRVWDTESSITSFSSSESPENACSVTGSDFGLICLVFVPTVSLSAGWVVGFVELCGSCVLDFLVGVVSPNVSRSVRSTSKSR